MSDDFDDLLVPAPRRPGRPTNAERDARAADRLKDAAHQAEIRRAGAGMSKITVEEFLLPVSKNFLARVTGIDPMTLTKRLRNCKPCGMAGANRPVYYFHQVLPYIVKPKMSAEEFAKSLNKADLPPEINNAFWNAQRARVRYKIEAQEAWETEDVVRFLGEVAIELKDSLTMAPEEMRQRAKMDDEQIALFEAMLDEMRTAIHDRLLDVAERTPARSMFDKPLFGVSSDDIDTTPDLPEWDDGEDEE